MSDAKCRYGCFQKGDGDQPCYECLTTAWQKAEAELEDALDVIESERAMREKAEAERDRLREVLEWYAGLKQYECDGVDPMDAPRICEDSGHRARKALSGGQEEGEHE